MSNPVSDYIVRATAANNQIRAFAITSRELVEHARQIHHTTPVATAALGRLLTGSAMMGSMMKGESDLLTITMRGDGPIHGITVTANSSGQVKGFVGNPHITIPLNYAGKLDVGAAIGYGTMTVSKDFGLKEPYNSELPLTTSEVAEDLTYYFAKSEQVPSAVALGVLIDKDYTVKQAGGFIIQLMPFAEEAVISLLEKKVASVTSVTALLEKGCSPEQLLEQVIGDFSIDIIDQIVPSYTCNCSKERVSKVLISVGKKELSSMVQEGKNIEINCHFCNTNYIFTPKELQNLTKYIL